MAVKSADLVVNPEVSNSGGVEVRRSSIAKASSGNVEEIVLPCYRRASIGSCHDFCKYGQKHAFEVKKRHSIAKIVPRDPLPQSSEEDVGGAKISVAKRRASVDFKLMKKTSVVKLSESIDTKPMKKEMEVKLGESVNSEPQISITTDSKRRDTPTKLQYRQKQVKNEVPVNRVKPFIHPKSHTSDLRETIRQGTSSVSMKVEMSSTPTCRLVETSSESTAHPVETSSESTAHPVETSESTAYPVETSLESTVKPVETSTESTTKAAATSSESTSKLVETSSESTFKPVETSSESTSKLVKTSLESTSKLVKTSSKSTAKPLKTSSKSTAKQQKTSSKSAAKLMETSSKSFTKKVEVSSDSIVKKVETSPKSTVKKLETSSKSMAKKVKTSPKSMAKKVETSSKSTAKKVEASPKSTVKKEEASPKSTVKKGPTVEKVEASSKSNSKVGDSSKTTPLKSKQLKLSVKHVISSKSNSVVAKQISSMNPSEGSHGQRNSDLNMTKNVAFSKVAARKLMTPLRASLPPKPSLIRVASIKARKHKSLKIVPHLKSQLKSRRDEREKPGNDEVEEKNLYVIKMESGNKTLQSNQNLSHDVELSPPQSLSPPKFSSSSQKDKEESEYESKYTTSEVEEDSFSVNLESERMEDGEALEMQEKGKPRKREIVCSEVKSKLNYRRGKLVEFESEKTSPRKLKFPRVTIFGENANVTAENQRQKFKRRYETGIHRIGTTSGPDKVVLRRRGMQGKKDPLGLFNNVIEETANKLAEIQKSKVKALVGAFETVISLQEKPLAISIS